MDEIDQKILTLLQKNARATNADIAKEVGMAPSGVFERIRKLEERGIILSYEARLHSKSIGLGLLAYIFVRSADKAGELKNARSLSKIPEVLEVHHIAGEDCYLLKVRTTDTEALGKLLREKIGALPSIQSTRTTIVMDTVKETMCLPVTETK
ncbi:Lrp/AsnC family transcriptional regulator [bacterium]|nr:Lrp/AsnC family transcriptional regulator [bacterium]